MNVKLVVVRPFASHAKGDVVSDSGEVAKILASESAANVVRVALAASGQLNAADTSGTNP
jgi:hypothetical protein